MKVFVVNEKQIKNAGLGVAGLMVVVFFLGYFLGEKQNESEKPADKISQQTVADEVAETASEGDEKSGIVSNAAKQSNDKKAQKSDKKKSEKTKVKSKDTKKQDKEKKQKAEKRKAEKKKEAKKSAKAAASKKATEKKQDKSKKVAEKVAADKKAADKKNLPAVTDSAALDSKKSGPVDSIYSIQAGMFSNEENATSFIEKLSVKKFDAYLSSFVSSSGALKYNVRVGKFEKREQARELLKEFQKSFSSPAYVVIAAP